MLTINYEKEAAIVNDIHARFGPAAGLEASRNLLEAIGADAARHLDEEVKSDIYRDLGTVTMYAMMTGQFPVIVKGITEFMGVMRTIAHKYVAEYPFLLDAEGKYEDVVVDRFVRERVAEGKQDPLFDEFLRLFDVRYLVRLQDGPLTPGAAPKGVVH